MKKILIILAILLIELPMSGLAAAPAQKESSADPSPDEKPWARGVSQESQSAALALFRSGNEALADLRYEEALKIYQDAIAQWQHPSIFFNMAICQVHSERLSDAMSSLERALSFGDAALGPDVYQEALTYQKLLQSQLANFELHVSPAQARVLLDGREITLEGGQFAARLPVGSHQLSIFLDRHVTERRALQLTPGENPPHHVTLSPITLAEIRMERPLPTLVPYALAGGGALAIGSGLLLREAAQSKLSAYDAAISMACSPGCAADKIPPGVGALEEDARVLEVLSYGSLVAGGVLAATGVGLAIWNQPRGVQDSGAAVRVSWDGARVAVRGQF